MMGGINNAIGLANQPVYGDAQKSDYLGGLDKLAKTSMESLQANLARSGALNSGRMSQGATDIGMNRNTNAADFFSKVPMMNRQATMSALPGLFGAGSQLMGVAPRNSKTSSSGTGHQSGSSSQTTSSPWYNTLTDMIPGMASAAMGMPMFGGGGGGGGAAPPMFNPSSLPNQMLPSPMGPDPSASIGQGQGGNPWWLNTMPQPSWGGG